MTTKHSFLLLLCIHSNTKDRQKKKDKDTMLNKTIHRKLKIVQYEPDNKTLMNAGALKE